MDTDEFPIRIVVSPSQSAYFAGEPFSVTITFTNISKSDPGPSILRPTTPTTRSHKRASHSITSAPIARPPTSPAGQRAVRTATNVVPSTSSSPNSTGNEEGKTRPVRRGLIGKTQDREPKGVEELPDLIEQRRRKMLSLSLQTDGLNEKKRDEGENAGYGSMRSSPPFLQRSLSSPSSPKISSPLSRSETLPLAASHPHARKTSSLDGQQAIHVNEPLSTPVQTSSSSNATTLSPLSPSSPSPLRQEISYGSTASNPPFMPFSGPASASSSSASLASVASVDSAASYNSINSVQSTNNVNAYSIPPTPSASTFSLALDPIAETTSPLTPGSGISPVNPDAGINFPPPPSSPNVLHMNPSISIHAATPVKDPTGASGPHPPKTPQSPVSPTKSGSRGHARTKSYSHAAHRPVTNTGIGMGYPSEVPSSPTLVNHPSQGQSFHLNGAPFGRRESDGTQLILYSYAQLKGTVVLTPLPSSSSSSTPRSISSSSSRPPSSSTPQTPRTPYTPNPNPSSGSSVGHKYGPTPLPPPSFSQSQSLPQIPPELPEPVQLTPSQTLLLLRSSLLKTSAGAVGGGSMDIGAMTSSLSISSSHSQKSFTQAHSRKSSLGLSVDVRSANTGSNAYGHDGVGAGRAQTHRRAASASIGGIGMGLLNALFSPLSPAADSGPTGGGGGSVMHPSRSAPSISSGPAPAGVVTSMSSPHVSSGPQGAKERPRTVSASSGLAGSGSAGSFGSFGSLSAWLTGSGPTTPTSGSFSKDIDSETPLPTFEVPPAMLAVDMTLKPGEEKSYTYTILLPSNLPPTFRGRTFRFAYELVVGVCRGGATTAPGNNKNLGLGISGVNGVPNGRATSGGSSAAAVTGGSTSKVMRVPIRVYTNVVVGRSPTPYDLLWPVFKRTNFSPGHRRGGIGRGVLSSSLIGKSRSKGGEKDVYAAKVVEVRKDGDKVVDSDRLRLGDKHKERQAVYEKKDKGLDELREYAKGLVESAAAAAVNKGDEDPDYLDDGDKTMTIGRSFSQASTLVKDEIMVEAEKTSIGCGEAVEILTRNPKKVSYDVNKDGIKVAVLTFTKAAYRLGETIQGIVELNERHSRARVVQLSAHLETHETLPTALATPPRPNTPAARQLKRVHAEHHSSFVLSTLRTTFSLDIPSDGSAAFQVKVGGSEEKTASRMSSHSHSPSVAPSSSSSSLNPHSPLPFNSAKHTVPASAPPYPSTFPTSPSPFSTAFTPSPLSPPPTFPLPPNSKPGGLEWKVRLCLLVAIASEDADPGTENVKVKGLVRDNFDQFEDGYGRIGRGYKGKDRGRGEWVSSWKAVTGVGSEKVKAPAKDKEAQPSQNQDDSNQNQQTQNQGVVRSWASFFASSILGSGEDPFDEDENDSDIDGLEGPPIYDGIKPDHAGGVGVGVEYGNDSKWFGDLLSPSSPVEDGEAGQQKRRTRIRGEWKELQVETVECEVPIRVWPGNTAYKPVDVIFDV